MSFFEFPNTRTYDSDLGWLIKHVNSYDEVISTLNQWIAENEPKLKDFETLYNMLMAGDLPPGVQNGIYKWCQTHIVDLVGSLVKLVFFGLTDDGYWVAYIPENWTDVVFNTTGLDISLPDYPEYGRLVLSLLVGGQ